MKKMLTFVISLLLGLVFVFGLFRYFVAWQELEESISSFSFWKWTLVLATSFLCLLSASLKWRAILKSFGSTASFRTIFEAHFSAFAITYLIPPAIFWADFFRARAVEDEISLTKRIASVFSDRILTTFFDLLLICLGSFLFFKEADGFFGRFTHIYLGFLFFSAFIVFFVLIFLLYSNLLQKMGILKLFLNSFSKENDIGGKVKKEIMKFFKNREGGLKKVLLLGLLRSSLMVFQCFLIVTFLGNQVGVLESLAIFGPTTASLETPISADLGSHDLTSALVFKGVGLTKGSGAAYAFIFRGANLTLVCLGSFFLLKIGLRSFRKRIVSKAKKVFNNL